MIIRPACMSDGEDLWRWRNDPDTRSASHQMAEIPLESHLAWLRSTLQDPAKQLMVAEVDGVAIGTFRADLESNGVAELSWTIAPEYRGRGLGIQMLSAALGIIGRPVRAEIKANNAVSIRLARRLGMTQMARVGDVLHFRIEAYAGPAADQ